VRGLGTDVFLVVFQNYIVGPNLSGGKDREPVAVRRESCSWKTTFLLDVRGLRGGGGIERGRRMSSG